MAASSLVVVPSVEGLAVASGEPSRWPCGHLCPKRLKGGGRLPLGSRSHEWRWRSAGDGGDPQKKGEIPSGLFPDGGGGGCSCSASSSKGGAVEMGGDLEIISVVSAVVNSQLHMFIRFRFKVKGAKMYFTTNTEILSDRPIVVEK